MYIYTRMVYLAALDSRREGPGLRDSCLDLRHLLTQEDDGLSVGLKLLANRLICPTGRVQDRLILGDLTETREREREGGRERERESDHKKEMKISNAGQPVIKLSISKREDT